VEAQMARRAFVAGERLNPAALQAKSQTAPPAIPATTAFLPTIDVFATTPIARPGVDVDRNPAGVHASLKATP
jgi:hypothetical protein